MDKYQTLREKNNPSNNVFPNIRTQNIPDAGVTGIKIDDGAVTTAKIADGAITHAKLGSQAVGNSNISDDAVSTNHIDDGAVTTGKIADGAITMQKIANGAVYGTKLSDGAVSTSKFFNEWRTLSYWFTQEGIDTWAKLIDWCTDLYQSRGFFRMIYKSGAGFYPLEIWVDQDNGEVQFMQLTSTGYVAFGPYIDSDADLMFFITSYANDIYLLRFAS